LKPIIVRTPSAVSAITVAPAATAVMALDRGTLARLASLAATPEYSERKWSSALS
jgi:hypothetical protein